MDADGSASDDGAATTAPGMPGVVLGAHALGTPGEQEIADAALAVEAEKKQFADKARQDQSAVAALLRYIDKDLADPSFEMPYFEDAHGSLTYLAGVVQLRRVVEDTVHRRKLIEIVSKFAVLWIVAVIVIVAFQGFGWFSLSPAVLVTLLGTTTANVFGLAVIVLHGMFRADPLDFIRHLEAGKAPPSAVKRSDVAADGASGI